MKRGLLLCGMQTAWVGEKDLARQQLAKALQYPVAGGYGQLKLLPFWDRFSATGVFEKIVAPLKPATLDPAPSTLRN